MKKQLEAFVSPQTCFSIENWWLEEELSLSPAVYARVGDFEYSITDSWPARGGGGNLSSSTRVNEYGLTVSYNVAPFSLTMKGKAVQCVFNISTHGGQVFYTSTTPHGTVLPIVIRYNDILGGVMLRVKAPSSASHAESKKQPTKIHDVYYVSDESYEVRGVTPINAVTSKIIPDTEAFSFLTNVNMYFPRPIYQWTLSGVVQIDKSLLDAYGVWGGSYSLTGDRENPYPDGISLLTIKDGVSGEATLEFNHDTLNKTVTITVLSHTSKVCDIRDLAEVGAPVFPNTICFAQ